MTRNIKALGLALVAALALGAVLAAGASATTHKFLVDHGSGEQAHLTAEAENTQVFMWSTTNSKKRFSCNKVNIVTGTGTVKDGASEATAGSKYEECVAIDEEAGKEVAMFPEFNKCHYLFFGETTKGNPTENGEHANVEIKCEKVGEEIEFKVTALKLKCDNIPQQVIKHAVRYENKTTESGITDITIKFTPHNIKNTTLNTVACPTGTGSPVEHTNGLYTGNVTVTGFKDTAHKEPTSISVDPG
jgi:hypothetical protein